MKSDKSDMYSVSNISSLQIRRMNTVLLKSLLQLEFSCIMIHKYAFISVNYII